MKTLIVIFVAVFIGTTGFLYFYKYLPNQNFEPVQSIEVNDDCGKEGDSLCVGSVANEVGCYRKCCSGLKPMLSLKYSGACVSTPAPGMPASCSNCGNGICEKNNGEDECSCSEDCK